jgi:hypothetical protein
MSLLALRKWAHSEERDLGVQNVCVGFPESNACDFVLIEEFVPTHLNSCKIWGDLVM